MMEWIREQTNKTRSRLSVGYRRHRVGRSRSLGCMCCWQNTDTMVVLLEYNITKLTGEDLSIADIYIKLKNGILWYETTGFSKKEESNERF